MNPIPFLLRHRHAGLLAVALTLGLLAAFAARAYIDGQLAIERDRLAPAAATVQVVVAKRDLARGDPVDADTMAVRALPQAFASAGVLTPDRFDAVSGGTLNTPLRAGEPLLQSAVSPADAGGFSARVHRGIRALTIAVDEINSMSGMLQPGDRIDLVLSIRLPRDIGGPPQELTRPLMQDVRVLATGRQSRPGMDDRQPRAYTAITVEVTPAQAQRLVVAQRNGRLTALLRNPGDREQMAQRPMDVYGLLDIQPPTAAQAARPELIVGGVGALRQPESAMPPGSSQTPAGPSQLAPTDAGPQDRPVRSGVVPPSPTSSIPGGPRPPGAGIPPPSLISSAPPSQSPSSLPARALGVQVEADVHANPYASDLRNP